jgi:hypothetical protein
MRDSLVTKILQFLLSLLSKEALLGLISHTATAFVRKTDEDSLRFEISAHRLRSAEDHVKSQEVRERLDKLFKE